MKSICVLEKEEDKIRGLIIREDKEKFIPLSEFEIISPYGFLESFSHNIDKLGERLNSQEKKLGLEIVSVLCKLPFEEGKTKIVEDVIPLAPGRKKRIFAKDIEMAKKYIEDLILDISEVSYHHIILDCQIDGKSYSKIPSCIEGKRLGIRSLIVYGERKLYEEFFRLFDYVDRKFKGFVWEPLSQIGANFRGSLSIPYLVVDIKKTHSTCFGIKEKEVLFKRFSFGENTLRTAIENKFFISSSLAQQIVSRHLSFEDPKFYSGKEIVLKEKNEYLNLACVSLNTLVREVLLSGLEEIIYTLKDWVDLDERLSILFLGRIPLIKGFVKLLQENFPSINIELPFFRSPYASLLGCAKYASTRFLEKREIDSLNLWERILSFYKSYF